MQEEKGCFPFSVIDFLCSSVTGPAVFVYDTVSNLDGGILQAKVLVSLPWLFALHIVAKNRGKKPTENTLDETTYKSRKIG